MRRVVGSDCLPSNVAVAIVCHLEALGKSNRATWPWSCFSTSVVVAISPRVRPAQSAAGAVNVKDCSPETARPGRQRTAPCLVGEPHDDPPTVPHSFRGWSVLPNAYQESHAVGAPPLRDDGEGIAIGTWIAEALNAEAPAGSAAGASTHGSRRVDRSVARVTRSRRAGPPATAIALSLAFFFGALTTLVATHPATAHPVAVAPAPAALAVAPAPAALAVAAPHAEPVRPAISGRASGAEPTRIITVAAVPRPSRPISPRRPSTTGARSSMSAPPKSADESGPDLRVARRP
jgi:hypothetical protein